MAFFLAKSSLKKSVDIFRSFVEMNSMFQVTYGLLFLYGCHFRYGTTTVTHSQEKRRAVAHTHRAESNIEGL